ncbi:MAG: Glu-tRNA(Gln) amidotransferase subunit GatD [DPANN group archaeon]|nr:Glu-tRNA(Gln) amidotransferase subunit GatD [DPANN group archaeon]
MSSQQLKKILDDLKIVIGSKIVVKTKDTIYEGILMPRSELSDQNTIVMKLDNGYNVGILYTKDVSIQASKTKAIVRTLGKQKQVNQKFDPKKPKISLVSTGGTISARVDYKTGGVYFLMDPEEILSGVPELKDIINLDSIKSPFKVGSEDMSPKDYIVLAKTIAKELNSGADGVIVTHGTDTLHYTSAALSFMLRDLSKPVALVGAQKSSDRSSFDGAINLICAARYVASDMAGVAVVMHGSLNDDYCLVTPGTKVRKMHTSRRDAFRPINALPIAKIWHDGKCEIIDKAYKKKSDSKVTLDAKFEDKVAIVHTYPGAKTDILDFYVANRYKGIVIGATALGHVPSSWLSSLKKMIDAGISVVIASQTLYGSTHPHVYRQLIELDNIGVIFVKDMLPEVAYIKLGWVLAHVTKSDDVKKMMLENYAGEFTTCLTLNMFLY